MPRTRRFCTDDCYPECRCSRWPDYKNRWGDYVRPHPGADWWDPNNEGLCAWAAYQPVGAASFAASLTDLTGQGHDAGDPGGGATPTWDAVNGWKFDGVADYLTTTFVPNLDQTQSILCQYTNLVHADNDCLFGMYDGGMMGCVIDQRASLQFGYYNTTLAGALGTVAHPAAGNAGLAGAFGYVNGIADSVAQGAGPGPQSVLVAFIGALNTSLSSLFTAFYIQAFAIYDCTLTPAQMLAISAAMAAL